jgi:putative phosphoesterase
MKLLIVSDIHGNWPALEAVLQAEPDFDEAAFCGDVMDYGPSPIECLRWLQEDVEYLVCGNHDYALAFDSDCRCMGSFREYSLATRAWHRTLVSEFDRDFLQSMSKLRYFRWDDQKIRMAHATPRGDLFEYLSMDKWEEQIQGLDADYVLLGHTHVQGMRTFGNTIVLNPGSVGLARDGGREACYAILSEGHIVLKRIPYDVEQTISLLQKAPLPETVINGLAAVLRGSGSKGSTAPQATST